MYADMAAAATLGQRLFFDKRYSGALATTEDPLIGGLGTMGDTGKIACASCHAGRGLDDRRSKPGNVSLGADFLSRNSLPLVNASFYRWTNWAGRFAAQWELPMAVVENAKNMNGDRMRVVHLIFDKYKADYEAVFGGTLDAAIGTDAARFPASAKPKPAGGTDGPWEAMAAADREIANRIFVNFGKALEAYMRKLVSRNAPLDRFVAGNVDALGDDEIRGLKLFVGGAGCISCHSGPTMSDGGFHNIGVQQTGAHVPASDNGRFADVTPLVGSAFNVDGVYSDNRTSGRLTGLTATPPDTDKGLFRTASLRGIAETAPYMHAGQLATLEDVVAFYDRGGDAAAVGTQGREDGAARPQHPRSRRPGRVPARAVGRRGAGRAAGGHLGAVNTSRLPARRSRGGQAPGGCGRPATTRDGTRAASTRRRSRSRPRPAELARPGAAPSTRA